jgi:formylglycine-generating enzyme required for sulfatase activity
MLSLLLLLHGCASTTGRVVDLGRSVEPSASTLVREDGLPYPMISVPEGVFEMGSGASTPENLTHQVTLSRAFRIGAVEVTRGLWDDTLGLDSAGASRCPRCPVVGVSWAEAVAFCNRLSDLEGLPRAYRIRGDKVTWRRGSRGYRLPTEAEWEYAARAGGPPPELDRLSTIAWYAENSGGRIQPVAIRAGNPWGLHDMLGNAREWVWDGFGPLDARPLRDPAGLEGAHHRVVRGGAWDLLGPDLRLGERDAALPGYRDEAQGFRLAR